MAAVFVDATYYIALLLPRDALHADALQLIPKLRDTDLVTADPILTEVLAHVSGLGPTARRSAVDLVQLLREDEQTTIVRQTAELFDRGLALYEQRMDKGYSLTDTMSMVVCADHAIMEVLTYDHHFEQEGLTALLRR